MTALLAFDTATERLHIGLVVGEETWTVDTEGGARASSSLIPAIRQLLGRAGIELHDLDAIAFGRGPGAFTGLRTACSVAQGIAMGACKPVLAIDTLMAVAEDARHRTGAIDIWVAMDARMGEIYAAHYAFAQGTWKADTPPALYTPAALQARWQLEPPSSIAGSAHAAFGARLATGDAIVVADATPHGLALLECARTVWARGEAVEASMALPLYVRDRVALTAAEREAGQSLQVAT